MGGMDSWRGVSHKTSSMDIDVVPNTLTSQDLGRLHTSCRGHVLTYTRFEE